MRLHAASALSLPDPCDSKGAWRLMPASRCSSTKSTGEPSASAATSPDGCAADPSVALPLAPAIRPLLPPSATIARRKAATSSIQRSRIWQNCFSFSRTTRFRSLPTRQMSYLAPLPAAACGHA